MSLLFFKKIQIHTLNDSFPTAQCCPTLTKGSKWQISQIWESCVFRLDLAHSTSSLNLEQKHSSCWKILRSRHNDIAWCQCTQGSTLTFFLPDVHDRHILLIYKKCHFQELLPFVTVRQNVVCKANGWKAWQMWCWCIHFGVHTLLHTNEPTFTSVERGLWDAWNLSLRNWSFLFNTKRKKQTCWVTGEVNMCRTCRYCKLAEEVDFSCLFVQLKVN